MRPLHFAIVGAGTAGIATAILLAKQNIHVTLFEKVPHLDPVGAGLLLQPAGLAVFEHLGLLDDALKLGARVNGLEGRLPNQQLLINSHYHQVDPQYYGLGIHRSSLCHILASKAEHLSDLIHWQMNADITAYTETSTDVRLFGQIDQQNYEGSFDGLIIANGSRSTLRPSHWIKVDQAYPWGAKWIIVPECLSLDPTILHQFYQGAKVMLGILPTGAMPNQPQQRLSSLFWSMPTPLLEHFLRRTEDRQQWLNQIACKWPEVAAWLDTVIHQETASGSVQSQQWLSANYRDVVLSQFGQGRVGVIGDAAHAMSPQLGQGANMALLDAWALGQSIQCARQAETLDWTQLWQHYHQQRRSSTQFYQFLSRLITPLYQSDYWWAGGLRDLSFSWMYKIPYFRKEMALTVSGLKSSMFGQMHYHDIAHPQSIPNTKSLEQLSKKY